MRHARPTVRPARALARPVRAVLVGLAAVVAAVVLAACTSSAVSGEGTGGSDTASSGPAGFPSASGSPGLSSGSSAVGNGGSASSTAPPQPEQRLTITGTTSHRTYHATVWDSDDIADCATHAYGEPMIRFLGAHPCRGAHRVLATVPLGGRTVAISTISTSFPGTPADPYAATSQFIKLEMADGTGSINDLLREGGTLPGAANIPSTEAFTIVGQDDGVTVFDAWYLDGTTADQDPVLVALEKDLFLTPLTSA